jgi:pyruvate dehydrogenase E1 component alpha subunit/2-oxoisovalerate dehydrogenase E1 component alpha subunit
MPRNNDRKRRAAPATAAKTFSLISDAKLKQLYAKMLRCRLLDERLGQLHRRSRYLSMASNESVLVGAAIDLRRDDWLVPRHGEFVSRFLKGASISAILSGLESDKLDLASIKTAGLSTPPNRASTPGGTGVGDALRIVAPIPSLAAQLGLAAGIAVAARARNKGDVVMVFSESATVSSAQLRPTLQFASRQRLPLLLLVQASPPSKRVPSPGKDASRALIIAAQACGIPVIPVDRTDAVAMYRVAFESIHKARHDGGPTVIVSADWRLRGTGRRKEADEPSDPIEKMEAYLTAKGLFTAPWKQSLLNRFIDEAEVAQSGTGSKT